MKKLLELQEQRGAKIASMKAINEKANAANRDFDDAEKREFDNTEREVRSLNDQIERLQKLAAFEREGQRSDDSNHEYNREVRSYSLAAAVQGALSGKLSGREKEVHDELTRNREGRSGAGIHIAVPTEVLLGGMERRVFDYSGNYAGWGYPNHMNSSGSGALISTDVGPLADRLRPVLMMERMGATVLRNLTGWLDLPNMLTSGTARFIQEGDFASRSIPTFGKMSLTPKTVSAEYLISRKMILQTNNTVEAILRKDLAFILAQELDSKAISGTGTNTQPIPATALEPLGVLKAPGVPKVTTETVISDTTANLIAELEFDNVDGSTGFLTNPTVMKAVRRFKDSTGHVIPQGEVFHGQRVESSTQVPNNIGTGSNKSALIYGAWSELYVCYWSAVDILLNPYHPDVAGQGGALLHAFLDVDTAVRHPEAFAYAEI
jgi:HK97 family phage major capsid protein